MFPLEVWIAGIMLVSLTLYGLTGGADFGGGVLDLLARGPRARAQRELINRAIAPIWEANHVWLIVVIVLLFTAFPLAFAAIMTVLHIPLMVMLVGIVLRGSAFAFRAYGLQSEAARRGWERVFAIASVITPVMLGVALGATISEKIRVDVTTGMPQTDFFSSWLAPFPFALGFFVLALFAFLAAVYLAVEAEDTELKEDFRGRALTMAVGVGFLAGVCLLLAVNGAPLLFRGLSGYGWSIPFQIITGLTAVGAIMALWQRRYQLARVLAVLQVTLLIWGWGIAQFPYIVPPDLTLADTAAPATVLRPVLIALIIGLLVIGPAFWYLYALFKGHPLKTKSSNVATNSQKKGI